jgi:phospholipid/cholesterol/gamma-HCH transport system permease protein
MIMHVLHLAVDQAEPLGIAFALAFCQQVPLIVCAGLLAIQLAAVSTQELLEYQQNQQLDVLRWMGISAIDYLLFPRLLAGFILFPLLLIFAFTIGLCTATLMAAQQYNQGDVLLFWGGIRSILSLRTLILILMKGCCLGLTIALTGYTWGQTPLERSERSNQTDLDRWTPAQAAISAWGLAMLCNVALSL